MVGEILRNSQRKVLNGFQLACGRDGFTLIELLIVMSIIAVLAGMSLFALQGSREAARDAQRKADLEKIRSGLELYRADCGNYPILATGADFATTYGTSLTGGEGVCTPANSNVYISENPSDPVGGNDYFYQSDATGDTYDICAALEGVTTEHANCPSASGYDCGDGTCSYHVENP